MRLGDYVLATPARLGAGRGLEASARSVAVQAGRGGSDRLAPSLRRRPQRAGKKGGEALGPNPTDRGRPGTKHHLIVDANGIPLAARTSPANVHDSCLFETMLDAIGPIRTGRRGRPRRRPGKVHADKGYDYARCRAACAKRGIEHRIARIGIESKERLGRYRWVVERTFAWLAKFRRLSVRYERRADIHCALLELGCALICWNYLRRL